MSSIKDFILLIPCYNNFDGLVKSVNSVHYPLDKFEILIVDDGSEISITIENLKINNSELNIQLIRLEKNQGIVTALNTGLKAIKNRTDYKYIARLDAGDTCHPERFTKQVQFLDINPDVFLLGTWCRFENPITKKGYDYITKTKHKEIIKQMHYKCSFIHPTVMFRKKVLETIGDYPTDYQHAEDYSYFWSIMKIYKTAILPQKLVSIELSGSAVSSVNYRRQIGSRKKIAQKYGTIQRFKFLGILILLIKLLIPKSIIQCIKQLN